MNAILKRIRSSSASACEHSVDIERRASRRALRRAAVLEQRQVERFDFKNAIGQYPHRALAAPR
jgi:hypothetical protein